MQVEVDYYISDKLEEVMKMAINYDNTHFHSKLLTLKTNVKTFSKKKHVVYISLYSETSDGIIESIDLNSIYKDKEHSYKKDSKLISSNTCFQCKKKEYITKNYKIKMSTTIEKSIVINNIEDDAKTKKNAECQTVIKE